MVFAKTQFKSLTTTIVREKALNMSAFYFVKSNIEKNINLEYNATNKLRKGEIKCTIYMQIYMYTLEEVKVINQ